MSKSRRLAIQLGCAVATHLLVGVLGFILGQSS